MGILTVHILHIYLLELWQLRRSTFHIQMTGNLGEYTIEIHFEIMYNL